MDTTLMKFSKYKVWSKNVYREKSAEVVVGTETALENRDSLTSTEGLNNL